MASASEAVRRLTIQTSAPGADQTAASLRGVSKAMDNVTVSSQATERATLSAEAGFARLERQYRTATAQQAAYERIQRQVNMAVSQNPALQERANVVLAAAAERMKVFGGAANDNARKIGLNSFEMKNLGFQLNDIGTMLAMGQSPFRIMASQGGQVYQILAGANGGITGAIKDLGMRMVAFLGPLGLVAAGLAAAGAAAVYMFGHFKTEGPTAEKLLAEHDRLLKVIKDSYDKVTNSAKNWYEQSKSVTQLQLLQQEIDLRQKLNAEVGKAISKSTTFGGIGDFIAGAKTVKADLLPFEDAIFRLQDGFKQGAPNVKEFQDEVAKIALLSPALQKLGLDLVNSVGDAAKFQQALLQIKDAMKLIEGGSLDGDARGRLGLPEPTAVRAQISSYEQLIQRTKDRVAELQLEASAAGQTEGAVTKMRLAHEMERAAKRSNIEVTAEMRAEWDRFGDSIAKAEKAAKEVSGLKNLDADIKFTFDTMFLSDAEKQIATILKQVHGDDWQKMMDGPQASAMRFNATMAETVDLFKSVGKDMFTAFLSGKNVMDAMVQSLDNVANKLASQAFEDLWMGIATLNPAQIAKGGLEAGASKRVGSFTGDVKEKRRANDNDAPQTDEERKAA